MKKEKASKRDTYLRGKYGITERTFHTMLAVNRGKCWICDKTPKTTLNVDHDHHTLQVRGLLCFFCNKKRIGRHRREHAKLFLSAYHYLKQEFDWRDDVDSRQIAKHEVNPKGQKHRSKR